MPVQKRDKALYAWGASQRRQSGLHVLWQIYGVLACGQLNKVGLHFDTALCQDEQLISIRSHLRSHTLCPSESTSNRT